VTRPPRDLPAIDLLRMGKGPNCPVNLLFVVDPRVAYSSTLSAIARPFGCTSPSDHLREFITGARRPTAAFGGSEAFR
jgi:hypothetical protein